MMKRNNRSKGFSLIELMTTVLIIGVLSAIAWPMYQKTVQKGNRAEAKSGLNDVAQRLQRCYTVYGKFNDANCVVYTQLTTGTSKITTSGRGFYEIKFTAQTAVAYTLEARAVLPPQTADTANGCNVLTLDEKGVRGPTACWQ
jgi:prepilin-type N-terminal cleavage/methylation domain-containing protein